MATKISLSDFLGFNRSAIFFNDLSLSDIFFILVLLHDILDVRSPWDVLSQLEFFMPSSIVVPTDMKALSFTSEAFYNR